MKLKNPGIRSRSIDYIGIRISGIAVRFPCLRKERFLCFSNYKNH